MNELLVDRLKKARAEQGLKQSDVAEKLGLKANTISNWEKGRTEPDIDSFVKLCDIYQIDCAALLSDVYAFKRVETDISLPEYDHIQKYRFIAKHSPDGANVVNTVLDRECAIAEKLKAQGDTRDSTSSLSPSAETIPMRFLSYYQRMASAGKGEFLFPDIPTEVIAVPDTPLSRRADFVIGVSGRSMEGTYFDGDKVLVEKAREVPIGKIGIFVRGTECFIKEAGEDRLISHNKDKGQYPDIVPDERGIDAIGIVLGKVGD